MRIAILGSFAMLVILATLDCGGGGPVSILFTGDDRGWITPAG